MGPYIRLAGILEVNVSTLTGAGSIGNYNTHATAKIFYKNRIYEVPVMTGNSLKHWHAYYMAQVYKSLGGTKLNEFCSKGIGLRGYAVDSSLNNPKDAQSETDAIADLCNDVHGFLIPEKQIKRDSLVRFSFAIPVLSDENLEVVSKFAVTHNRVDPRSVAPEETRMMVFKQEYSSALFGFTSSLDLAYVCKPMYSSGSQSSCDKNEPSLRVKSAVLAFTPMLMGMGSKQARALPIIRVMEVLAVLSNVPVPNIICGAYTDYMNESLDILAGYIKAFSNSKNARINVYCYSELRDGDKNRCDKIAETINTEQESITSTIEFKKYDSFSDLITQLAEDSVKYVS